MNIGVITPHLIEEAEVALPDATLDDITLKNVHQAQQVAVVRLNLFVMGEVHRLLLDVANAGTAVLRQGGEKVDSVIGSRALRATLDAWDEFPAICGAIGPGHASRGGHPLWHPCRDASRHRAARPR